MNWDKIGILEYLSKLRGYRNYLEICTPTTGGQFARIDRSHFDVCHRLMYRCPVDFTDGLNIEFRAPDLDIGHCIADIHHGGFRYDIMLVDPWHEYESSLRDMQVALSLLTDTGSIVVHDCCPPTDNIISPKFVPGAWCGVTFIAYVDFVAQNDGIEYRTVDTDFGCGVIQRSHISVKANRFFMFRESWNAVRYDSSAAFRFVQKHRYALLNLVSVEEFIRTEAHGVLMSSDDQL